MCLQPRLTFLTRPVGLIPNLRSVEQNRKRLFIPEGGRWRSTQRKTESNSWAVCGIEHGLLLLFGVGDDCRRVSEEFSVETGSDFAGPYSSSLRNDFREWRVKRDAFYSFILPLSAGGKWEEKIKPNKRLETQDCRWIDFIRRNVETCENSPLMGIEASDSGRTFETFLFFSCIRLPTHRSYLSVPAEARTHLLNLRALSSRFGARWFWCEMKWSWQNRKWEGEMTGRRRWLSFVFREVLWALSVIRLHHGRTRFCGFVESTRSVWANLIGR